MEVLRAMIERFCDFRKCGKSFKTKFNRQVYCSKECRMDAKWDRMPTTVARVPKTIICTKCNHKMTLEEIKNKG